MIEVSRFEGGITVNGHANYAPFGQDIVCAGISFCSKTIIAAKPMMQMPDNTI